MADQAVYNSQKNREAWSKNTGAMLFKEAIASTFWVDMIDDSEVVQTKYGITYSKLGGKIVNNITGNISADGDNAIFPVHRPLVEPGVYGDAIAKGTGETKRYMFSKGYFNQIRKVADVERGMRRVWSMSMNADTSTGGKLKTHLARTIDTQHTQALYCGFSKNLYAGTADNGLGLKINFHPGMYYLVGTTVTAVGTENYTKTVANIDSAVSAVTGYLTADALINLRAKCRSLRIEPVRKENGQDYWPIVINTLQEASLLRDPQFISAIRAGYNGIPASFPEFGTYSYRFMNFYIIVNDMLTRAFDTTSGIDNFYGTAEDTGGDPWFYPNVTTSSTHACAVILGKNALAKWDFEPVHMDIENEDFNNVRELAYIYVNGIWRPDAVEETAGSALGLYSRGNAAIAVNSATSVYNKSSLIVMTKVN